MKPLSAISPLLCRMTLLLQLLMGAPSPSAAQERYAAEVFGSYALESDIPFEHPAPGGASVELLSDVYQPAGDTASLRPLLLFFHGGGFQGGDKVSKIGTRLCGSFARRGYVVASVNYRLSSKAELSSDTAYVLAVYRAVQDGHAAARFFRQNAERFRIDPSKLFLAGSSAGAKTAIHMAYWDQDEVPRFIDTARLGPLDAAEPPHGGVPRFLGIVNCWGALLDLQWMDAGGTPVYCVHGTKDTLVPFDSSFSYHGFKYGSTAIHQRALDLGIPTGLRLFEGAGHTLDNDGSKQDEAINSASAWMRTMLLAPEKRKKQVEPGGAGASPENE